MEITIIGVSAHVSRRVIPALESHCNHFDLVGLIARNQSSACLDLNAIYPVRYGIYQLGRAPSKQSWVYVATPPASHFEVIKHCLDCGYHIICEKPLVLTHVELTTLQSYALEAKRIVYEVDMFKYHDAYDDFITTYASHKEFRKKILTAFAIPKMNGKNFRYDPSRPDSGALIDLGFYPLSVLWDCLGGRPYELELGSVGQSSRRQVLKEQAFVINSDNLVFEGFVSLDSDYKNFLTYHVPEIHYESEYQPFYSKPEQGGTCAVSKTISEEKGVRLIHDDQFSKMFESISRRLESNIYAGRQQFILEMVNRLTV